MRTALPLVVLIVLAGCDAAASKPAAKAKRPAATSKAQPPASLPLVSKPEPAVPVWRVVSVHDRAGDVRGRCRLARHRERAVRCCAGSREIQEKGRATMNLMGLVVAVAGLWMVGMCIAKSSQPKFSSGVYLADVRRKSCYPVLRSAHTLVTAVAIVLVGIFLSERLSTPKEPLADTQNTTLACAAVITALLIEYGLFRLIVDAVDVLIDGTRRKGEGQ